MSIIRNGVLLAKTGVTDYNSMSNHPTVNGTELKGNITIDLESIISAPTLPTGSNIKQDKLYVVLGKLYWYNGTDWVALSDSAGNNYLSGTGTSIMNGKINHMNVVTANTVGSATSIPSITFDTEGHVVSCNGVNAYPPTTVGSANQYWMAQDGGTGKWQSSGAVASGNQYLVNGDTVFNYIKNNMGGGVTAQTILTYIYPIGSIYMSTKDVSPQEFLGGIWEEINNAVLVGAGSVFTAGNTGGSKTSTVKISGSVSSMTVTPSSVTLVKGNIPQMTSTTNGGHTHTTTYGACWDSGSTPYRPSYRDDGSNSTFYWDYANEHSHNFGNSSPTKITPVVNTLTQPTITYTDQTVDVMMPYQTVSIWKRIL